jgi:hypothetical protein
MVWKRSKNFWVALSGRLAETISFLLAGIASASIVNTFQLTKEEDRMKRAKTVVDFLFIVSIVASVLVVGPGTCLADQPGNVNSASADDSRSDGVIRDIEGHSSIRLKDVAAQVAAYKRAGRIKRLYGEAFSSGVSPEESAQDFLEANARLLGVDQADLGDRYIQPIMYEPETGQYKFTGVYYSQSKDGIPVFGTRLVLLVRNEPDYPLVLASADLRSISQFETRIGSRVLNRFAGAQSRPGSCQRPESLARTGQLHRGRAGDLGGRG